MPSKKSKTPSNRAQSSPEPTFANSGAEPRVFEGDELALKELARELAAQLGREDRVLLEGPMGAGKSTFARALIAAIGVDQPAEGSPSFAIAHEYASARGEIAHIDFYRFRNEAEIEDAGLGGYFWERAMLVITEWISSFPDFERSVVSSLGFHQRVWRITLQFGERPELRRAEITSNNK